MNIGIDEMKRLKKTVKISFSVDELQGKTEEEIKKMIDEKLAQEERKAFFDYLMSLGKYAAAKPPRKEE